MAPMALPTHSNSFLWCPYYANPTHFGLLLLHIPQYCWFHFCFNVSCSWSVIFAYLVCFTCREGSGWVLSYSLTCTADPPPNLLALEIRICVKLAGFWNVRKIRFLQSPMCCLVCFCVPLWNIELFLCMLCLHLCPPHLNLLWFQGQNNT